MIRPFVFCAGFLLVAASAFASGADLSAGGCPGDPGVSNSLGTLDCAGGLAYPFFATFQPAESMSDFGGFELEIDGYVDGDLSTTATFWDLTNSAVLGISHVPDVPGACGGYFKWAAAPGSGVGVAEENLGTSTFRIVGLGFRSSTYSLSGGAKVFGMEFTIDTSWSIESGGTRAGCPLPVCLVLKQLTPQHGLYANGWQPGTALTTPASFGNTLTVNTSGGTCIAVPARRHTWGQLKSLYR